MRVGTWGRPSNKPIHSTYSAEETERVSSLPHKAHLVPDTSLISDFLMQINPAPHRLMIVKLPGH